MKFDFTGKGVVITGATEGIGYSAAELFGTLGARVAICGRTQSKLDKAIAELKAKGIDVFGEICDVGNSKALLAFADHCENALGSIDVWVSNAGIYPQYNIIDTSEELFDQIINTNLKAVYIGGKIARDKMGKKGGVLINASSFSSVMPSIGSGVYAATKSGVTSMTKTLASELAPYNVRVCGYIPGLIATPMTQPVIDKVADQLLAPIPCRRFGTPEDIANGIIFLASDYASYVNGVCLEISGGKYSTQNPGAAWK